MKYTAIIIIIIIIDILASILQLSHGRSTAQIEFTNALHRFPEQSMSVRHEIQLYHQQQYCIHAL